MPNVILVDKHDNVLGYEDKLTAHQKGLLHRAFSIFILRSNVGATEVLLQQRAHDKYHAGGLWTNTCCSHPEPHETTLVAAQRRLVEEMGFSVPLAEIDCFTYRASFDNGLIEHEVDHVFIGYFDSHIKIHPNQEEVQDYKWVSIENACKDYLASPSRFTPWFYQAMQFVEKYVQLNGNKL